MTTPLDETARPLPPEPESEIATAPGSLPYSEIQAREALQERQFRHDNTIVPSAPRPDAPVEVWAVTGSDMPVRRAAAYYTADGSRPGLDVASVALFPARVEWEPRAGYLTHWTGVLPPQPEGTVVRYRIAGWLGLGDRAAAPDHWAQDGQGMWFRYGEEDGITTFAYRVEAPGSGYPAPRVPAWARDAVIYQIFLDRFHPGTVDGRFPAARGPRERHGGTLEGVRMSLPYLADLGVTCLWLSPLCASESYHRYDATDLYRVDPELGTNEELRMLTANAHGVGMRVILDLVPSHCSWHHPAFLAAQQDRAASSYRWFTFTEWPSRYRSFLNMSPKLPSFNTDDPGAREHIIGSAVAWLRECGVDGFRLDHAIGPSMDFWVAYRAATQEAAPDCFSVGEVTDTPDAVRRYRNRLDAVLDFQLSGALRLAFGTGAWSLARLDTILAQQDSYMATGPGRVSFLDNHDMDRFLRVARDEIWRLQLAALCQFTLAPTPVIYYGTEVGMSQPRDFAEEGCGGDVLARADMPWDPELWDRDLLTFYRALIALRHAQPGLRTGARRTVWLDDGAGTYAYLRTGAGGDGLLVAFNRGAVASTLAFDRISLAAKTASPGGATFGTQLLATSDTAVVAAGALDARLTLAPRSGAVFAWHGQASTSGNRR